MRSFKSSHRFFALFPVGAKSVLTRLRVNGERIIWPLTLTLALSLGGCASTTQPSTRTEGAVADLMKDPNYEAVRSSDGRVKEWARKALHYVNDLSFELKREREK